MLIVVSIKRAYRKIPPKMKILLWYLYRWMSLSKTIAQNLDGRGPTSVSSMMTSGVKRFNVCSSHVQWHVLFVAFNLPPPHNISNMFERWFTGLGRSLASLILGGTGAESIDGSETERNNRSSGGVVTVRNFHSGVCSLYFHEAMCPNVYAYSCGKYAGNP